MLELDQVAAYLLHRGLIDAHTIVAGDLVVSALPRRNNNFEVTSDTGPSYLVKQGIGRDKVLTVDHEAFIYGLLTSATHGKALCRHLPRFCFYDAEDHVLVLELLRPSESLTEYHLRTGRFPVRYSAWVARILAELHTVTRGKELEMERYSALSRKAPWVLSIHRPTTRMLREASGANVQLIQTIQQFPQLGKSLDELGESWRASALIHGDIKWDNFVLHSTGPLRARALKIVDWELTSAGDPCWDTGSVFERYLNFWLGSLPISGEDPPEEYLQMARFPLEVMQPAMRGFWRSYSRYMGLQPGESAEWLVRAVRCGAARLIQSAFEQGQGEARITGQALYLLQLSLNMLERPEEACEYLLGIQL